MMLLLHARTALASPHARAVCQHCQHDAKDDVFTLCKLGQTAKWLSCSFQKGSHNQAARAYLASITLDNISADRALIVEIDMSSTAHR